ncbi:hypothetical protein BAUCODRAFT_137936, partial [Baudoinia panamericana UAMH 10762]
TSITSRHFQPRRQDASHTPTHARARWYQPVIAGQELPDANLETHVAFLLCWPYYRIRCCQHGWYACELRRVPERSQEPSTQEPCAREALNGEGGYWSKVLRSGVQYGIGCEEHVLTATHSLVVTGEQYPACTYTVKHGTQRRLVYLCNALNSSLYRLGA